MISIEDAQRIILNHTRLLPVENVPLRHGIYRATSTCNLSSANLMSLARGNGLLRLGANSKLASGSSAEITLLDRGFEMGSGDNVSQ